MDAQTPPAAPPPKTEAAFLERLDLIAADLPKRLRQCASFTRLHMHLIAVSTVSDMAGACDVAPSVYVRFCQAMGFSGYSEMQALFRSRFKGGAGDPIKGFAEGATTPGRTSELLGRYSEAGRNALIKLQKTKPSEALERCASGLAKARVIHLAGLSRGFSIVSNMACIFDQLGVPAMLHGGAGMANSATSVLEGDALIAATFEPFAEETTRLASILSKRGVPIFALTDSAACPLSEVATEMLIVEEDPVAGVRGMGAAFAVSSALAVSVQALREQG